MPDISKLSRCYRRYGAIHTYHSSPYHPIILLMESLNIFNELDFIREIFEGLYQLILS
jgi:hypothetical protein